MGSNASVRSRAPASHFSARSYDRTRAKGRQPGRPRGLPTRGGHTNLRTPACTSTASAIAQGSNSSSSQRLRQRPRLRELVLHTVITVRMLMLNAISFALVSGKVIL